MPVSAAGNATAAQHIPDRGDQARGQLFLYFSAPFRRPRMVSPKCIDGLGRPVDSIPLGWPSVTAYNAPSTPAYPISLLRVWERRL